MIDDLPLGSKRLNSTIGQRERHALLTHRAFCRSRWPVTVRRRHRPAPPTPAVEPDLPAFLTALYPDPKPKT
jgi:hypothetical protein